MGLQAYRLGARSRDTRFHTALHCNCVPRLQPLVCERQSEEEWSAVVYLLYCMLDVGVPCLSSGVVGLLVTTSPYTRLVSGG